MVRTGARVRSRGRCSGSICPTFTRCSHADGGAKSIIINIQRHLQTSSALISIGALHLQHSVKRKSRQVCIQLPTYAAKVALPAFVLRTPQCCAPCSNRSISPAGRAHSSKPAAAGLPLRAHAQTDIRTDARQMQRHCCAYYAGSAKVGGCVVASPSLTSERACSSSDDR